MILQKKLQNFFIIFFNLLRKNFFLFLNKFDDFDSIKIIS